MLIAVILIAAFTTFATRPPVTKPPAQIKNDPHELVMPDAKIADAIRHDFESITGPGSVDVSTDNGRLLSIHILVPTLNSEFCNPIYDHEIKLFRLFPDLNFDFYVRLREAR